MNDHSSHIPILNYWCKMECLQGHVTKDQTVCCRQTKFLYFQITGCNPYRREIDNHTNKRDWVIAHT